MSRKAFIQNTLASLLIVLTAVTIARSDDKSWNNTAGGSFQLDTNWTPTGAPAANDNAIFDLTAPDQYTVTLNEDAANQRLLARRGTVNLNLGTHVYSLTSDTDPSLSVGHAAGQFIDLRLSNGTLNSVDTLVDAADVNPNTEFSTMRLADGTTWNSSGTITIGDTGNGSISLINGATLTGHALVVGVSGNGTFSHDGSPGGTDNDLIVKTTTVTVGVNAGSKGVIAPERGTWENTGLTQIGLGGDGRAGVDTIYKTDTLDIGVLAGSTGTIATAGGGDVRVAGLMRVGVSGEGNFDFLSGVLHAGSVVLAVNSGSTGRLELDEGGGTITSTVDVGLRGNAQLFITGGASFSSGAMRLGVFAGSSGIFGADAEFGGGWTTNGDLTVGDAGKGRASIGNDLTATTHGDAHIAKQNGSEGTFGLAGNGDIPAKNPSTWNIDGSLFIAGDKSVGHSGVGKLTISDKSTVTVGAGATVYANGTVELINGSSISTKNGLTLKGGTLNGFGSVGGDARSEGGHIAMSSQSSGRGAAGTLLIDGALSMDSKSTLDIGLGGTTQGFPGTDPFGIDLNGGYDFLKVTGDATIGGKLSVGFFNGFENDVKSSDVFTILDASNPLVGIFANVASGGRLKTTDGLFTFKVNYGAGSAFDSSDVVLSDAQPFAGPAVPLPPMVWSGGAMLAGLIATRMRFKRS